LQASLLNQSYILAGNLLETFNHVKKFAESYS